MGQEIFNELKANGEIVESSPLYDQLRPIADAITRAAQPQYNHPVKFYLLHEAQPDAFAAPGGNVYVVDSLLYFVKNTDELAGTLCHEVSHTIHHDTVRRYGKQQEIAEREIGAAMLLGPIALKGWVFPCSGNCIPSATRATWSHERTWLVRIFALPRDTTPGDWCGSSRTSRIPIWKNYHNSCPTIPPFSIALIYSSGISAHILWFLGSSAPIQIGDDRFQFRKTPRRCSCIEGRERKSSRNELRRAAVKVEKYSVYEEEQDNGDTF